MGQLLHGSATTTEAVRRTIQHSQESLRVLARRHGINQKTVAKWRRRTSTADLPTGPKEAKSTVLTVEQEAIIVAFRRHTLLPLDDCLYALQPTIPGLTRSSLHRCLQRHGISRLPSVEGEKTAKHKFKTYPLGYFHVDIAEVRTEEGKLHLFVAIDRTTKFAFIELHEKANTRVSGDFLGRLFKAKGHEVRLMSPEYVQPYVKAQKTDDRDAEAIAEAATRPTMRFVSLKSEAQLDLQVLHRTRQRLVSARTRLTNQLPAVLLERGVILPKRRRDRRMGAPAARPSHPNVVVVALAAKLARIAWAVLRHGRSFDHQAFAVA